MAIVHIDSDIEMVTALTHWVSLTGYPVPEELKKRIFMSWVEAGWVREAEGQIEMELEGLA